MQREAAAKKESEPSSSSEVECLGPAAPAPQVDDDTDIKLTSSCGVIKSLAKEYTIKKEKCESLSEDAPPA